MARFNCAICRRAAGVKIASIMARVTTVTWTIIGGSSRRLYDRPAFITRPRSGAPDSARSRVPRSDELSLQPVHVLFFVAAGASRTARGRRCRLPRGPVDAAVVHAPRRRISSFRSLSSCSLTLAPILSCIGSVKLGRAIQKEDALDQRFGVLHLVDGLLLDVVAEPLVLPVLAHFGVQKILIDGGQLLGERLIESLNNLGIPLHVECCLLFVWLWFPVTYYLFLRGGPATVSAHVLDFFLEIQAESRFVRAPSIPG